MEVKNKRFFAPSRMERATKLVICLVIFLLLNCGNVFALEESQIEYAISFGEDLRNINRTMTDETFNEMINKINEYNNKYYYKTVTITSTTVNFYFAPENHTVIDNSSFYYPYMISYNGATYKDTSSVQMGLPVGGYWYFEQGLKKKDGTFYYEPGTVIGNWEIENAVYKTPYFEFSANKVGTATLENEDGNINTYYKNSFPIWTNSYGTFREIGNLYIDRNYILEDIFYPTLYIKKSNFNMTNIWNYEEYSFFKHEEINGYIRYSINIRNELITSPYFYNIELLTVNSEMSDDINIKFVILNNPTTGGIIIENNSGDIISGDEIKDDTTLGDINNTIGSINDSINEKYNEDESELNNLTSGEILENMGYEITEDPNADLWDTIINGLKEVLTGNGNVIFEFELRKTKHKINSSQITMPDNELKTFISLAVNFYFLIQMFQFIKRTIDQINEGNLKVMHDVDADCYFF